MSALTLKKQTAMVEPVGLSGLTDSGIYVLDHDEARGVTDHRPVSLLYRVLQLGEDCGELEVGKVYVATNPYCFTAVSYEKGEFYQMRSENLICEVVGYDEKAQALESVA